MVAPLENTSTALPLAVAAAELAASAFEPAALAEGLGHQRRGVPACAIEAQRRQRVDLWVDLGDPPLQRIEQIERGEVAAVQAIDDVLGHCAWSHHDERKACLISRNAGFRRGWHAGQQGRALGSRNRNGAQAA